MYSDLELRAYVQKKAQPTYEHGYNYANLKVHDPWFSKVFSKQTFFPVIKFFKAGIFMTAQTWFSSVLISNLIYTTFLWDEGKNFKTVICKDTDLSRWQVPNILMPKSLQSTCRKGSEGVLSLLLSTWLKWTKGINFCYRT